MKDFKTFAREKFLKGAEEHKQRWDKYSINVSEEIKGECADLYNYAELLDDTELASRIRMFSEEIYNRM